MDNFFALEPLIIARLKETLKDRVQDVLSGADIESLRRLPNLNPAIYVLYRGYDISTQPPYMGKVRLRQEWLVVLAVTHVRSPRTGEEARRTAGPLISDIIEALIGWRPETGLGLTPLELATGPQWQFQSGQMHIPLVFSTQFTVIGA